MDAECVQHGVDAMSNMCPTCVQQDTRPAVVHTTKRAGYQEKAAALVVLYEHANWLHVRQFMDRMIANGSRSFHDIVQKMRNSGVPSYLW